MKNKTKVRISLVLSLGICFLSFLHSQQHSVIFSISQPPPFDVKAGPDVVFDDVMPVYLTVEVQGGSGTYTYRWTPGYLLDDSTAASPQVVSIGENTNFFVEVSDGHCSKSAVLVVELSTTLSNQPVTESIQVYPQPIVDMFYLSFQEDITDLLLVDLTGREIWKSVFNNSRGPYRLDGLLPGMYILLVMNDHFVTKRLLICKQ